MEKANTLCRVLFTSPHLAAARPSPQLSIARAEPLNITPLHCRPRSSITLRTMGAGHQHRHHGGHYHHHHDNTYLVSSNKNDAGVRVTRLGLGVNICMAVSKGVGGYIFHSQALMADAIHALSKPSTPSILSPLLRAPVSLRRPTP